MSIMLQPHQERVVTERDELTSKVIALEAFFDNTIYAALADQDKELLARQFNAMVTYLAILNQRIERFHL